MLSGDSTAFVSPSDNIKSVPVAGKCKAISRVSTLSWACTPWVVPAGTESGESEIVSS